jgi:hypothetical protein
MATAALDAYYLYRKTTDTGRLALSSPTSLFGSGVDSSISALTNIGFTFNFNDTDYTQFAACTDGYIQLGAADAADFTNDLIQVDTRTILCPWWDDLRTMGNGLRYELQGTTPNRKLVVDFDSQIFWNDSDPNLKFQIVLYETTNRIEFRYDDPASAGGATSNASVGAKITIADNTGTNADGKFRDFVGSTVSPYDVENNSNGGWSQVMRDGAVVKIPNNGQIGTINLDYPGDPNNRQQSQQYYFLFSPDEEGGGGGGGDSGTDEGAKFNVDPEGAPDGPLITRFSAVNTNYTKSGGTEQIPFTLQQPGVFSIKRRTVAYKATSGDPNE